MIKKLFYLFAVFLVAVPAFAANNIIIAHDGKSTFTIVVPNASLSPLSNAAQEMQKDILMATQAKVAIKEDTEVAKNASPVISLGATLQAKAAGITADGIEDGGFRFQTKNGNLYIIGPDTAKGQHTKNGGTSTGTANGIYSFLEEYLNVRWLMPGDLGRDVPQIKTFAIPPLNHVEAPLFNLRQLPYILENLNAVKDWKERQKLRYYSMNFYYQHSWRKIVPASMYKEHPQWFALVNGTRKPKGSTYKLETTNAEMVRYFAEQVIAKLKADPDLTAYSLSPTDLGGWSESAASKALYDPVPEASPSGRPSVTPLVLKFYHDVAKIVEKEYPQGRVSGYIYGDYLFPPQQGSMKLPENFIPMFAPSIDYGFKLYQKSTRETFTQLMDGWSKVVPTEWYFYDLPNTWMDAGKASHFQVGSTGLVTPPGTQILDFIFPQLVKHHIRGARIYGTKSWSNVALGNYILAKMLWNPKLKASDLQKDWLRRAYGPKAGALMDQFYQKLEAAFEEYSQKEAIGFRMTDAYLKGIYGPHFADLEKVLLEAKSCQMTEKQRKRFQLIEDNFIILRWRLDNMGVLKSTFASPLQRTDTQINAILGQSASEIGAGFSLFPALVKKFERRIPSIKVQFTEGAKPQSAKRPSSFMLSDTFLIRASQDGTLRIRCSKANQGSFFAYYQIRTTAHRRVLSKGMLYKDAVIEVPVTAGTAYYLTIPANVGIGYQITIENAALAEGGMQKNVLHLYGKTAPIQVMSASTGSVAMLQNAHSVTIIKSLPGAGTAQRGEAQLQNGYKNVAVNQLLDHHWRFQTDADAQGLQAGVIKAAFKDDYWPEISAIDWWQNQGFPEYFGMAWYRKKFTAPQLSKNQRLLLYFGAIDGDATIYVNGQKADEHHIGTKEQSYAGWNQPVIVDITPYLQSEGNVIAVKVTSKEVGSSGIYSGAGLFVAEKR